jgi:hypothetical protein
MHEIGISAYALGLLLYIVKRLSVLHLPMVIPEKMVALNKIAHIMGHIMPQIDWILDFQHVEGARHHQKHLVRAMGHEQQADESRSQNVEVVVLPVAIGGTCRVWQDTNVTASSKPKLGFLSMRERRTVNSTASNVLKDSILLTNGVPIKDLYDITAESALHACQKGWIKTLEDTTVIQTIEDLSMRKKLGNYDMKRTIQTIATSTILVCASGHPTLNRLFAYSLIDHGRDYLVTISAVHQHTETAASHIPVFNAQLPIENPRHSSISSNIESSQWSNFGFGFPTAETRELNPIVEFSLDDSPPVPLSFLSTADTDRISENDAPISINNQLIEESPFYPDRQEILQLVEKQDQELKQKDDIIKQLQTQINQLLSEKEQSHSNFREVYQELSMLKQQFGLDAITNNLMPSFPSASASTLNPSAYSYSTTYDDRTEVTGYIDPSLIVKSSQLGNDNSLVSKGQEDSMDCDTQS